MTQKQYASFSAAEQLSLEVQYVLGLADEAKKLRERVSLSTLPTVTRFRKAVNTGKEVDSEEG